MYHHDDTRFYITGETIAIFYSEKYQFFDGKNDLSVDLLLQFFANRIELIRIILLIFFPRDSFLFSNSVQPYQSIYVIIETIAKEV